MWKVRRKVAALALVAGAVFALLLWWRTPSPESVESAESTGPAASPPSASQLPVHVDEPSLGYVGSSACRACHAKQYQAWERSHHHHAMAEATPETVLGDFDDALFRQSEHGIRFSREGAHYQVNIELLGQPPTRHRVAYTFGFVPLQQYLIPAEDGRWQVYPIAWDTARERWFQVPDEEAATGSLLHWQGMFGNYNVMCSPCHSTNLKKGYDSKADRYETTWSEIRVGCEACHGPAKKHLAWAATADESQKDRGLIHKKRLDRKTAKHFAETHRRVSSKRRSQPIDEVSLCGPCHSRRQAISPQAVFGEPYLDHYLPELLRENLYFADGQIMDEVFVLGSFLQSKMHRRGVVCSSCHDVHSGELVVPEKQLCIRCHEPTRFATPKLGTPNPCSDCHQDKTPAWAARAIDEAHGKRNGPRPPHRGELLHGGRQKRRPAAAAVLKQALGQVPDSGELHYLLGLLLREITTTAKRPSTSPASCCRITRASSTTTSRCSSSSNAKKRAVGEAVKSARSVPYPAMA